MTSKEQPTIAKAKYNTSFNTILEPNNPKNQGQTGLSQYNPQDVAVYQASKYQNNQGRQAQANGSSMNNVGYGSQYQNPALQRELAGNYDTSFNHRHLQRNTGASHMAVGGQQQQQKPNINPNYLSHHSHGHGHGHSHSHSQYSRNSSTIMAPSETSLPMSHHQSQPPPYQQHHQTHQNHSHSHYTNPNQQYYQPQTHHQITHHSSQLAGLEVQGQLVNLKIGEAPYKTPDSGISMSGGSAHPNHANNFNKPAAGKTRSHTTLADDSSSKIKTRSRSNNINNHATKKLYNNTNHQSVNDGVKNKLGSYDQGYGVINQSSLTGFKKIGQSSNVRQGFF